MAANFWTSSHCSKKLLEQEEVETIQPADKEQGLTLEDIKIIKIHMSNYIKVLAQQVKVRQRVVATAITYFRRVYTRKSFTEYDPRLVAPTCVYLASKAEESTVQAKLLIYYMKKIHDKHRYEIKDVLEMEMKLLEALDYYLIIYHPYRPLVQFLQDAGLNELTSIAWSLLNDSYKTDLILIYPPYMIALACIYVACIIKEKEAHTWFEELRVDMNVIKNISMEIVDYYDNYRAIPEEKINAALGKLPQRL
uniref:Cyclin-like domain-containing protein n=1 Tax=Araucaria cunninghamii TaxID=56994 RepID=A0A0D6R9B9_ARACU